MLNAQNSSSEESSMQKAIEFLNQLGQQESFSIISKEGSNHHEIDSAIIYHLSPQGFMMIHSKTNEILAFSLEANLEIGTTAENLLTQDLLKAVILINNEKSINSPKSITDETYGPYVEALWGQVNCTNEFGSTINVTNLFTPNNYAAGCVAISQASILKHYEWPLKGTGSHSYTDNHGSSTGTYEADFGATDYHSQEALNRYKGKSSSTNEREIAGQLAFHSAVSLDMDFEYNGSTSNVNKIPNTLSSYFRFTSLYRNRSSNSFWPIIDSNMVWEKPVILAVKASNGAGHSVICDGMMIQSGNYFYHLNMGWWGSTNGWYRIKGSFNAGGYNYVTGGVLNILPLPMLHKPIVWDEAESTNLIWEYPTKAKAQAFEIQQNTNNQGWETISNTTVDTFLVIYPEINQSYTYRIRAKTNGRWFNNWGDETILLWNYTGINENSIANVNTYPSPFSNQLNIEITDLNLTDITIKIYNQLGTLVFKTDIINQNTTSINTSDWAPGFYVVQLNNGRKTSTTKVIKL